MSETEYVKLDGNISGYQYLVRSGEGFYALMGDKVPVLSLGMEVVLREDRGDRLGHGHVPSGLFAPGETVTIVGFREAFKRGEADHIISVTNGRITGWVKPSNIQNDLAPEIPVDSSDGSPSRLRNEVFISYSHADRKWLQRLQVHLKPVERLGTVTRWDDTMIRPGSNWREELRRAIECAKVAVLLVSADFLASDFIDKNELPPLLSAAQTDGAVVLPVIVSPCQFEQTESLSRFQAVNLPSRPLVSLNKAHREAVFDSAVKSIASALRG